MEQTFKPVQTVYYRQFQIPSNCGGVYKQRIVIMYASECDGLVAAYLYMNENTWFMNVSRENTMQNVISKGFCFDLTSVGDSIRVAPQFVKGVRDLGIETLKHKSQREQLIVFPQIYLLKVDSGEGWINEFSWFSISRTQSSESLVELTKEIPLLFDLYYGPCENYQPGCLQSREITRAFQDGGGISLGCFSSENPINP